MPHPRPHGNTTPLRVLHCPTDVGGNPHGLAAAERAIGLESTSVTFLADGRGFDTDEVLWRPEHSQLQRERLRRALLRRALRDFDIIHFNFGSSIMPMRRPWGHASLRSHSFPMRVAFHLYAALFELRDVARLRRAGKGIVVTYQGDDARQGDVSLEQFDESIAQHVPPGYYCARSDALKRRQVARFGQLAHRVYALNPDLLHVLPPDARFMPYASVDPRSWTPSVRSQDATRPIRVVHAPSNRDTKGTDRIVEVVTRLQADPSAPPLEFRLLEGLERDDVRAACADADLMVDQLRSGWYGAVAVEAMALEVPVACYIRDDDLRFLPASMAEELPVIRTDADSLEATLRDWCSRSDECRALGRRSREYVERWHDPIAIAKGLASDYAAMQPGPRGSVVTA